MKRTVWMMVALFAASAACADSCFRFSVAAKDGSQFVGIYWAADALDAEMQLSEVAREAVGIRSNEPLQGLQGPDRIPRRFCEDYDRVLT
jgi:hypothetical protein